MVGFGLVCEEPWREEEAKIAEFLRLGANALDTLDAMDLSEAARDPFRVGLGLGLGSVVALLPLSFGLCVD
jgi:hypothetical protein